MRTGWLLDLYARSGEGVVLWLLGEDGIRYRFTSIFPVTFYAAGSPVQLRALWKHLKSQPVQVELTRTQRRELFQASPLTVLAVQ
ncbi:MAG: hypothetical protein KKD28_07705, partial [Chloroflexi bacterium]|nr:hypothetical protein [Chloroflexota bacterium]